MTFADLPAGGSVFLDSNTFIYHFISDPNYGAACTSLLERLERHEVEGWTSPHILAEVSHRLMTIEARSTFGWAYQGVAARLRRHPEHLQKLHRFHEAVSRIILLGLRTILVTDLHVEQAAEISRQYGLLTNDCPLITLMRDRGLKNLASNDSDFDRIPGILRYAPR
jgi:predicted nucleic acid-binding protein